MARSASRRCRIARAEVDGRAPGIHADESLGDRIGARGLESEEPSARRRGRAAIAGTGISTGQQIASYAVFAVVATLGVGTPVVIYFALGERSTAILDRLKGWMAQHNAAIMSVLLLIIGAKLVGDAISGFSA
jgi:hypothetical protein